LTARGSHANIRTQTILEIAGGAMESVWGKTPRGFQRTVLLVLLDMRCSSGEPGCVLMVQGTGGGKSSIP